MRILLVHGHRFDVDKDGAIYSHRAAGSHIWSRYLRIFDEVEIIGRRQTQPLSRRGILADGEKVDFTFIPDFKESPLSFIAKNRSVTRLLKKRLLDADGLIATNSTSGLTAVTLARTLGKPYMLEVVGAIGSSYWHHGSLRGKVMSPIEEFRTRRAAWNAPFISYVTQRYLQRRYPTRGRSLACSDVEIPAPSDEVFAARLSRINNNMPAITLGLVGPVDLHYKGLDVALRGLRKMGRSYVKLHILGIGDQSKWQRRAKSLGVDGQLVFDGTLATREEVFRWFDSLDLYLQPSWTEGLPRSVVEAMSRACPVLASNVGGLPELLEICATHAPGDANKLATQVDLALRSKRWMKNRARYNFQKAKEYSSPHLEKLRESFLHEFRDYVEEHGSR